MVCHARNLKRKTELSLESGGSDDHAQSYINKSTVRLRYLTRNGTYLIKIKWIDNVTLGGIAADDCGGLGTRLVMWWRTRSSPCAIIISAGRCRMKGLRGLRDKIRENLIQSRLWYFQQRRGATCNMEGVKLDVTSPKLDSSRSFAAVGGRTGNGE